MIAAIEIGAELADTIEFLGFLAMVVLIWYFMYRQL